MAKDEKGNIQSDSQASEGMSEEEIDNNLMDTFPASDPPSWTLGINHLQEVESEEDKSTDNSD